MDRIKEIEERVKADNGQPEYSVADQVQALADRAYLLSQLSAVTAERDRLREAVNAFRPLFHKMGAVMTSLSDGLEDEGDRVYLGSTNDADRINSMKDTYFNWRLDYDADGRALTAAAKVQP